ncbi:ribonuclease J [Patescibacteria group bacterium]|nr:ribonuclease J [Patescibacteria group bacterium]
MDGLRIVSLGGFSKVNGNMYLYHFLPEGKEENDKILIIDCGVSFPGDDIFGVDLIIPDISYLDGKKDKIAGIILTHGHEDHIGALSFILPELPERTPLYAPKLAGALIKDKLEENGIRVEINFFERGSNFSLGPFSITPVGVTHSMPDTFHFFIKTPVGNFYHGSDFKFDLTPPDGLAPELSKIAALGSLGVTTLLSDCLGAENEGVSPSESTLNQIFENEIRTSKGRVFVTAISSNIYRWQKAIESSRKFNRKISLVGFSIQKNIRISNELGYLGVKKEEFVDFKEAVKMTDKQITFLIAGSLGQTGSSLERVVLGKHKVKIREGDKVIFSSPDYIPGTGGAIYQLIDELILQGAEVVYNESGQSLHVSGHAYREEMKLLINLTSPRFLLPIGGERRHARQYANLAKAMGYRPEQILIPEAGAMPTFWSDGRVDLNFQYKARQVLIDGLGIGDVGKTVLRDRGILAKNGMVVIIIQTDSKNNNIVGQIEVVSRGFVYIKENKRLLDQLRKKAEEIYRKQSVPIFNLSHVRFRLQAETEEFIYQKTGREPMVLPVILKT